MKICIFFNPTGLFLISGLIMHLNPVTLQECCQFLLFCIFFARVFAPRHTLSNLKDWLFGNLDVNMPVVAFQIGSAKPFNPSEKTYCFFRPFRHFCQPRAVTDDAVFHREMQNRTGFVPWFETYNYVNSRYNSVMARNYIRTSIYMTDSRLY